VTVLLGSGVQEVFAALPARVQEQASGLFDLIEQYPEMFARRPRGMFRGYRYFVVGRYLFYYSVSADEGYPARPDAASVAISLVRTVSYLSSSPTFSFPAFRIPWSFV
jgi:hypothetical protein